MQTVHLLSSLPKTSHINEHQKCSWPLQADAAAWWGRTVERWMTCVCFWVHSKIHTVSPIYIQARRTLYIEWMIMRWDEWEAVRETKWTVVGPLTWTHWKRTGNWLLQSAEFYPRQRKVQCNFECNISLSILVHRGYRHAHYGQQLQPTSTVMHRELEQK